VRLPILCLHSFCFTNITTAYLSTYLAKTFSVIGEQFLNCVGVFVCTVFCWYYSVTKFIFPTVGMFLVGNMNVEEVTVDSKGRIQIPKAVRDKVGLHAGGKARLKVEKDTVVIIPPISAEEFIKEMEGCIKEGEAAMDPLKLKKIWEPIEK
jgi:AbrB family looped-hinge helix DNA binding protein